MAMRVQSSAGASVRQSQQRRKPNWRNTVTTIMQLLGASIALAWFTTVVWDFRLDNLSIGLMQPIDNDLLQGLYNYLNKNIPDQMVHASASFALGGGYAGILLYAIGGRGRKLLAARHLAGKFATWERMFLLALLPALLFMITPWPLLAQWPDVLPAPCDCGPMYEVNDFVQTPDVFRLAVAGVIMIATVTATHFFITRPAELAWQSVVNEEKSERKKIQTKYVTLLEDYVKQASEKSAEKMRRETAERQLQIVTENARRDLQIVSEKLTQMTEFATQQKQQLGEKDATIVAYQAELANRPPAPLFIAPPALANDLASVERQINSNQRAALDLLRRYPFNEWVPTDELTSQLADMNLGLKRPSLRRLYLSLKEKGLIEKDGEYCLALSVPGIWPD